jgi:pimeloyl-ACP methyl ester carboxylesterase
MAADIRPESMQTALRVRAPADQRHLLPRIAMPTLLIWGELDARSPLTVARQLERAIDGAKLVVLPGVGHMSNLEQPDQFNALDQAGMRRRRSMGDHASGHCERRHRPR